MSRLQVLELTTDRHLACMMDTACGGAGNTSVESDFVAVALSTRSARLARSGSVTSKLICNCFQVYYQCAWRKLAIWVVESQLCVAGTTAGTLFMYLPNFLSRNQVPGPFPLNPSDEFAHIVLLYDNSCCIGPIGLMTQGIARKQLKYN